MRQTELNLSDKLISCLILFPFLSHSDTSEINLSGLDVAIPPYRDSHNDQPSLQIRDEGCRCAAILRTDSLVLSVPLIMGKDEDIHNKSGSLLREVAESTPTLPCILLLSTNFSSSRLISL